MAEYTVKDVEIKKELPSFAKGPAHVLLLTLENGSGTERAEMFAMKSTPVPEVGSKVDGTIEQSDYGPKFKKAGGRGGGKSFGRSPAENKKIVRQHSQEMALMREANLIAAGNSNLVGDQLRHLIDWFENDANGKQNKGVEIDGTTSDVPADMSGTPFEGS